MHEAGEGLALLGGSVGTARPVGAHRLSIGVPAQIFPSLSSFTSPFVFHTLQTAYFSFAPRIFQGVYHLPVASY